MKLQNNFILACPSSLNSLDAAKYFSRYTYEEKSGLLVLMRALFTTLHYLRVNVLSCVVVRIVRGNMYLYGHIYI